MTLLEKALNKLFFTPSRPQQGKTKKRGLRLESLENRELLSVSAAEFDAIRAQYEDLNLSSNYADYNFIDIQANSFNDQALRDAIDAASDTQKHDIIVFRTTSGSNTLRLDSTVSILSSASKYGSGMNGITFVSYDGTGNNTSLTIDAANQRGFDIRSIDVAFAGINVKNAKLTLASTNPTTKTADEAKVKPGSGAAIYIYDADLTLVSTAFTNNECTGNYSSGAAVFSWLGNVEIYDSTFENNKVKNSGTYGGYGGSIYVNGGTLKISDTDIKNSTAYYGGAIAVLNSQSVQILNDSTLTYNTAGHDGGAVYAKELVNKITIADSEFSNNSSGMSTSASLGGAVFQLDGELVVSDSDFISNKAYNSGKETSSTGKGGAIYFAGLNSSFERSLFERNFAGTGAGIYNVTNASTMTVNNCTFTSNTARVSGGGIYNAATEAKKSSLNISNNTTFTGNLATTGSGGGIYNAAVLTISDSEISRSESKTDGGGIFSAGKVSLTSVIVSNNRSNNGDGGGMYTTTPASITGSTFNDNWAYINGGGVQVGNGASIKNSYFQGNSANGDGGGIYGGTGVTLANSVIAGNFAKKSGGGYYGGLTTATNLTVVGNIAELSGGGLYVKVAGKQYLRNSIVAFNLSKGVSGTYYGGPDIRTTAKSTSTYLEVASSLINSHLTGNGKGFQDGYNNRSAGANPSFNRFPTTWNSNSVVWSSELWKDWDLTLADGSQAINNGNNAYNTERYDVRGVGFERIVDELIDMGAFEHGAFVTAPQPPAVVITDVTGSNVLVSWTKVSNATHYRIDRTDSDGNTVTIANKTSLLYWEDKGLADGTYTYTVYSLVGTTESETGTSKEARVGDDIFPPATPIASASTTGNTVTIDWKAVPNATHYKVSLVVNGQLQLLQDNIIPDASGNCTWSASGLAKGIYTYAVQAVNGTLDSGYLRTAVSIGGPPAPVVLWTNPSTGTIKLNWNEIVEADHYKISQIVNNQLILVADNVTDLNYSISGLVPGNYVYAVQSVDADGLESGYKSIEAVVPEPPETVLDRPIVNAESLTYWSVSISWAAVTDADYYVIKRKVDDGEWKDVKTEFYGNSYVDNDVPEGNVSYSVMAMNADGERSKEGYAGIFIVQPPFSPTVSASVDDTGKVFLSWDKVPNATSYDVRRRIQGGEWVTLTDNWGGTSYVDKNAPEGYVEYSVRAFKEDVASGYETTPVDIVRPPQAPEVQTSILSANNTVKIDWNYDPNVEYYTIERRVAGEPWDTLIDNWSGTSYADQDAPDGNLEYRVRAFDADGRSSLASSSSIFTEWPPAAPNLTPVANPNGTVSLSWNPVERATSYEVRRREIGGQWVTLVDNWGGTSFTDTTAPVGDVQYTVIAYNGTVASPYNTKVVTVGERLAIPDVATSIQQDEKTVTLTWDTVPNAEYYDVRRRVGRRTIKHGQIADSTFP